jgi:undecaprenyl diphosphate synthase
MSLSLNYVRALITVFVADVLLACNSLVSESRSSGITPDIDAATFASRLCTGAVPDPDVLIRTSGEQRISNFLLWQTAYTELFFVDKNWPDMTRDDLRLVLHQFADRNRRYGG